MTKTAGFKLALGVIMLVLGFSQAASACEITCSDGSKCSGYDCHCDSGSAHCTGSATELENAYITYLKSWDLPGLDRVAEAATRMQQAQTVKESKAYFLAHLDYEAAVGALTEDERAVLDAWSHIDHTTLRSGRHRERPAIEK